MPIEMVWNDLKYHLIHESRCNTEKKLRREIKRWLNAHMHDIAYCNSKVDKVVEVVDRAFKNKFKFFMSSLKYFSIKILRHYEEISCRKKKKKIAFSGRTIN